MDAALYEKLLEEVRSELAQTAPRLGELQSVEAFLQRRLEIAEDKSSYQNVLADISADLNSQHQSLAELQRIDRFVSGKLGKSSFNLELAPIPAAPKAPAESLAKQTPPPAKKPDPKPPAKDDDTKEEAPPREKIFPDMSAASSGMTIEFGPDGFPIHNAGPGKGKTEKNSSKATVPGGAGMDGATINFGPDGFPLDLPKAAPKKK